MCYIIMKPEGKTFKGKVLQLLNKNLRAYIIENWDEYSKDSKKTYELNKTIRQKLDPSDVYTICAKLKLIKKCNYKTYLILTTKSRNQMCILQRNDVNGFFHRGSLKNFVSNFGRHSFHGHNRVQQSFSLHKRRGSFNGFGSF